MTCVMLQIFIQESLFSSQVELLSMRVLRSIPHLEMGFVHTASTH